MSAQEEFSFDKGYIIFVKVNEKNRGDLKNILEIENEDDLIVKWIDEGSRFLLAKSNIVKEKILECKELHPVLYETFLENK